MYINDERLMQAGKKPMKRSSIKSMDNSGAASRNANVGKSVDFAKMFKECKTLEKMNVDVVSTLRTSHGRYASTTIEADHVSIASQVESLPNQRMSQPIVSMPTS